MLRTSRFLSGKFLFRKKTPQIIEKKTLIRYAAITDWMFLANMKKIRMIIIMLPGKIMLSTIESPSISLNERIEVNCIVRKVNKGRHIEKSCMTRVRFLS